MHIITDRLTIRELTPSDAPFLVELLNSEGFINNIGDRGVKTEEKAIEMIESTYSERYPTHGLFAVVDHENQQWLGTVSYLKRPFLEFDDVGYAFLPQHWGQGYAFEATKALVDWAKAQGVEGLLGVVDHHNLPSQKLLEKLNFEPAGSVLMEGETDPILKFQRLL